MLQHKANTMGYIQKLIELHNQIVEDEKIFQNS